MLTQFVSTNTKDISSVYTLFFISCKAQIHSVNHCNPYANAQTDLLYVVCLFACLFYICMNTESTYASTVIGFLPFLLPSLPQRVK